MLFIFLNSIFLRFYLFIFRERGREGERGEKHQCVVAYHVPPTGHLACIPGMCPDWESNWRPFGFQASTQSTESHQPGHHMLFKEKWPIQGWDATCIFIWPSSHLYHLHAYLFPFLCVQHQQWHCLFINTFLSFVNISLPWIGHWDR